ncbi:AAA family ATPase [Shewanella baltica]|uniref:AAA family ATPase n=1 Tax=Shewanella baltica TaxID=62322 RepID=UPI003BB10250
MDFNVTISNVQHILNLEFNVDLSSNKVTGIVGLNGVGKTTLIRAIKNLQSSDTFLKTASPAFFKTVVA